MLAVLDLRRVSWRRQHARHEYLGYLTVTDETIRLSGREGNTEIDVALSIPCSAVVGVRVGTALDEQLAGEDAVVLELTDGEPIVLGPVGAGRLALNQLAHRLALAVEPPRQVA
ncbi:MAG: hypothetical protein QOE36_839 [Gaiellaceae bacterium]|jgi:hypothetical protein|nr:hypothetical protein [Gaiellaceae bacterium]